MPRLRDLSNALWYRFFRGILRCQLFAQMRLSLLDSYQPNPFGASPRRARNDPRDCHGRFDAMAAALPDEPLSCLDVGCGLGYFVFRLAARGGYGVGIDYERNSITAAKSLIVVNRVPNVAFIYGEVTAASASHLPTFDVVIFLSVFHHIARKSGEAAAIEFLRALSSRAGRYLVFDTGQPNEAGARWAPELTFMGPDPEAWITRMLKDLGFAKVQNLGAFASDVSSSARHLFLAAR